MMPTETPSTAHMILLDVSRIEPVVSFNERLRGDNNGELKEAIQR